jgi:hypothetical protein
MSIQEQALITGSMQNTTITITAQMDNLYLGIMNTNGGTHTKDGMGLGRIGASRIIWYAASIVIVSHAPQSRQ